MYYSFIVTYNTINSNGRSYTCSIALVEQLLTFTNYILIKLWMFSILKYKVKILYKIISWLISSV